MLSKCSSPKPEMYNVLVLGCELMTHASPFKDIFPINFVAVWFRNNLTFRRDHFYCPNRTENVLLFRFLFHTVCQQQCYSVRVEWRDVKSHPYMEKVLKESTYRHQKQQQKNSGFVTDARVFMKWSLKLCPFFPLFSRLLKVCYFLLFTHCQWCAFK